MHRHTCRVVHRCTYTWEISDATGRKRIPASLRHMKTDRFSKDRRQCISFLFASPCFTRSFHAHRACALRTVCSLLLCRAGCTYMLLWILIVRLTAVERPCTSKLGGLPSSQVHAEVSVVAYQTDPAVLHHIDMPVPRHPFRLLPYTQTPLRRRPDISARQRPPVFRHEKKLKDGRDGQKEDSPRERTHRHAETTPAVAPGEERGLPKGTRSLFLKTSSSSPSNAGRALFPSPQHCPSTHTYGSKYVHDTTCTLYIAVRIWTSSLTQTRAARFNLGTAAYTHVRLTRHPDRERRIGSEKTLFDLLSFPLFMRATNDT